MAFEKFILLYSSYSFAGKCRFDLSIEAKLKRIRTDIQEMSDVKGKRICIYTYILKMLVRLQKNILTYVVPAYME